MVNSLEISGGGAFKRTRSYKALNKKEGMNLAEMASFVQQCMREDAPGTAVLKVGVGWSRQIEGVEVTWGSEGVMSDEQPQRQAYQGPS